MGGRGSAGRALAGPPAPATRAGDLFAFGPGSIADQIDALADEKDRTGTLTPEQGERLAALRGERDRRRRQEADTLRAADRAAETLAHQDWQAGHGPDTPEQEQLRAAVAKIAHDIDPDGTHHGDVLVPLDRVRAAMPNLSREAFDTAVRDLHGDPDVWVTPDSDQARLSASQHAAAISYGGNDHHLIKIRDRTGGHGIHVESRPTDQ